MMATSSLPLLTITPGALTAVLVSCWGEYPNAAYGLLAERDGHLLRVLMQATVVSARSAVCAAKLPDDRVHAARSKADEPFHVGASIHAHLDGAAVPTPCDLDRLATRPVRPAIIVGLQDIDASDTRAWTITDGQPYELQLELVSLEAIATSGRGDERVLNPARVQARWRPSAPMIERDPRRRQRHDEIMNRYPDMQDHLDACAGAPGPAR